MIAIMNLLANKHKSKLTNLCIFILNFEQLKLKKRNCSFFELDLLVQL